MSTDESFYKNVFLLMQAVPASRQCADLFKKEMFNKPNTAGFIHISHYLLSVHNAKRFKKMFTWPVLNRADERKYRTEIKDYLGILAKENPDLKFPTILMSHLIQAGGIRFLTIMWKVSMISLRAYIMRKFEMKLLHVPHTSDKDMGKIFLKNINVETTVTNTKLHESIILSLDNFERYKEVNSIELNKIRTDIFETRESTKMSIHTAPVNSIVATRLIDIEDSNIIELWKASIANSLMFLNETNSNLNQLRILSQELCNLVSNLCHNTILDGSKLPKVNIETIAECFNNNIQVELYRNGCLDLHNLLLLFNETFKQVESYLKMTGLPNLSNIELEIEEHCKTIKKLKGAFIALKEQVSLILDETQSDQENKNINCALEVDFCYPIIQAAISNSQKFTFSIDECAHDENLLNSWPSPVQGKYKHLFQRYKHNASDSSKQTTQEYQSCRSTDNIVTERRSLQRQSFIRKTNSPNKSNVSPRYSKLFSLTNSKRNYFKDNNATSTPRLTRSRFTRTKSLVKSSNSSDTSSNATSKSFLSIS